MSDSDDDDNPSATENENDFNQPTPLNQPIVDPRGSRRLGQAPNYRHGVIVKIFSEGNRQKKFGQIFVWYDAVFYKS